MNPNVVISNTSGLATHGNDLSAEPGSTSVADNVTFSRERLPELRRGFKDFSTNLPDYSPSQLIVGSNGTDRYLHLDSGIWYYSTADSKWYRKGIDTTIFGYSPLGVAYASGTYYITTGTFVGSIAASSRSIAVLCGRRGASPAGTDGTGDAARFSVPWGICTDGAGSLFVADKDRHTLRKIVISTAVVTTLAGVDNTSGSSNSPSKFNAPRGVWSDGTNVYVCDTGNHTVRKVVIASGVTTTFAGTVGVAGDTDGTGTGASFTSPWGIWGDGAGSLYIFAGSKLRKVTYPGAVVTTIGTYTSASGEITGDGAGNLYLSKSDHTLSRVVISGGAETSMAGTASSSGWTDGVGSAARLNDPRGMVVNGNALIVAEFGNQSLRVFYPSTAYVGTIAGGFGTNLAATGVIVGPD